MTDQLTRSSSLQNLFAVITFFLTVKITFVSVIHSTNLETPIWPQTNYSA